VEFSKMEDNTKEQAPWWQPGLILFYKLSGWVAGPILLSVFFGKFLDMKFGTAPWIFLGLTATAFIISTFAILYVYTKEVKKIESADAKAKQDREEELKKSNKQ
jgi:F0F1-type ATP synthase assembly protein I